MSEVTFACSMTTSAIFIKIFLPPRSMANACTKNLWLQINSATDHMHINVFLAPFKPKLAVWTLLWKTATMHFCRVNKTELGVRKNVPYLAHRHPAQTGVQYTCPSIGTHLTHEREPLLPAYTVGLD